MYSLLGSSIAWNPLFWHQLTCLDTSSRKRSLEDPETEYRVENPNATNKQSQEYEEDITEDPVEEDVTEVSIEGDSFCGPTTPRDSPGQLNQCLPLGLLEHKGVVEKVKALPYSPQLSSSPPFDNRTTALRWDISASDDVELPTERSLTENYVAKDQTDDDILRDLLNLDSQRSSDTPLQYAADSQSSQIELNFPSSPTPASYRSSSPTQEMQLLSTPSPSEQSSRYEIVRDHYIGKVVPDSYLDRIRSSVDLTFSNEIWGDEYYFSDSGKFKFKHIEDFAPNPFREADRNATNQGLRQQAMRIPKRTMKGTWESFEAALNKASGGDRDEADPPMSLEEMERLIRSTIGKDTPPTLPQDLRPRVQNKKTIHYRSATHGNEIPTLVAPGLHVSRSGTAPPILRTTTNNAGICQGQLDTHPRLQDNLEGTTAEQQIGLIVESATLQPSKNAE